jgi:hypothetical protein
MIGILLLFALLGNHFAQYIDPLVNLLQPSSPGVLISIPGPIYVDVSSLKHQEAAVLRPQIIDNGAVYGPPIVGPPVVGPPVLQSPTYGHHYSSNQFMNDESTYRNQLLPSYPSSQSDDPSQLTNNRQSYPGQSDEPKILPLMLYDEREPLSLRNEELKFYRRNQLQDDALGQLQDGQLQSLGQVQYDEPPKEENDEPAKRQDDDNQIAKYRRQSRWGVPGCTFWSCRPVTPGPWPG